MMYGKVCRNRWLLAILFLLSGHFIAAAEDKPAWPFIIEVGKDADEAYLREWTEAGPFLDELKKDSDKTLAERFVAAWPEPCGKYEVVELEPWYKWRPYLLIVDESCTDYADHYFVALQEGRHFRLLMFVQSTFGLWGKPSFRIVDVGGERVLAYRHWIQGTGNQYLEYYFVYDKDIGVPRELDRSAIGRTLKELLPDGKSIWKGGGFDIDSLTYKNGVWNEDDGNCCPTGGYVHLQFKLEKGKLVLQDSQYDPNPEEPLPR